MPTPLELSEQGKWTWATMRDTSKQLIDKQAAKYGLLLNNNIFTNGFRNLIDIYAPYGAAPWSDDGQTCGFSSPQAVQATQFIWDMIYTDKSLPGPGVQADWTAGNIGMVLGRANAFATLGELPVRLGRGRRAGRAERLCAIARPERHRGLVGRAQRGPRGASSSSTR